MYYIYYFFHKGNIIKRYFILIKMKYVFIYGLVNLFYFPIQVSFLQDFLYVIHELVVIYLFLARQYCKNINSKEFNKEGIQLFKKGNMKLGTYKPTSCDFIGNGAFHIHWLLRVHEGYG